MVSIKSLKNLSFLVYGLGLTGQSVVKFFKKNKIKNFYVWDDKKKIPKNKRSYNLNRILNAVDYIVLSPGISLRNSENRGKLIKFKEKIITDLDLIFLLKKFSKSIVVTGTNGKSTTCKIIEHLLIKNKYQTLLGGNIGTPILNLETKKNSLLIIEASSFQLAYSKFIKPDFALLLNITNDHLDWHGNMKNYIDSKLKIFKYQKKNQHSIINRKLKLSFKKRNFLGKLTIPNIKEYLALKFKIKNFYLQSDLNDENMSFVFALSKLLNIKKKSFINSLNSFVGLPHRYETFLKKKNCIFINDSKATSFQATKYALKNTQNIFWILGGLPKKNDKISLNYLKKNIVKSYIIGRNVNFFKSQIQDKLDYSVTRNLKNSLALIFKDIKKFKKKNNSILFSPASASYDQYLNFEERGHDFKRLSRHYAKKYL